MKNFLRSSRWSIRLLIVCAMLGAGLLTIAPEPTRLPYFGLAMAMPPAEDAQQLGIEWFYTWSGNNQYIGQLRLPWVPMLQYGQIHNQIPQTYDGYILVFNEPNVTARNDGVTPQEAAGRFEVLRVHYPNAYLLCCGVSVWATDWLESFMAATDVRPDAWHAHAYTEEWITPTEAQRFLTEMHDLTGGEYWITEFGSVEGRLEDFQAMTGWFQSQPWIQRVAAYTNRQKDGAIWEIGEGVEMVDDQGNLSEIGMFYRDLIQQHRRKLD